MYDYLKVVMMPFFNKNWAEACRGRWAEPDCWRAGMQAF